MGRLGQHHGRREHRTELAGLGSQALEDRVCELNVAKQVHTLSHSGIVQGAWERGQTLKVHGWIYSLADGVLKDLGVSRCGTGRN